MARKSSKGRGRAGEMFSTPGGIIHHAASLSDLPRGRVVDYYGPPAAIDQQSSIVSSGGAKAPNLLTRFKQKGKK